MAALPTAVLLVRLVPEALALPTPEAMRPEFADHGRVEQSLSKASSDLKLRVQRQTEELSQANEGLLSEMLRRSEERFRLLVETVKDCAIFMLNPEGFVTSWNSGAEQMNGYSTQEMLVSTSRTQETEDLLVAIEDSGTGLDPRNVDRLFDNFFTTKTNGLGMGLPISRSIVQAHNARLWASQNDTHGATFQFTIPASH